MKMFANLVLSSNFVTQKHFPCELPRMNAEAIFLVVCDPPMNEL
jgi:hypothetical protein